MKNLVTMVMVFVMFLLVGCGSHPADSNNFQSKAPSADTPTAVNEAPAASSPTAEAPAAQAVPSLESAPASETPVVSNQALKLTSDTCVDPLPSDIKKGVMMMACNGSYITGTYEVPDLSNLVSSNIRSGITVAGVPGSLVANVEGHVSCGGDGEVGCVTTSRYKAVDTDRIAGGASIKVGYMIAGVTGFYNGPYSACNSDGQISCVSNASFKAVDMSLLVAGNIKSGVTISGVAGSVAVAPAAKDIRKGVSNGSLMASCRLAGSGVPVAEKCTYTNIGWTGISMGRMQDNATGLTWQYITQGITYPQAVQACADLNTAEGTTSWRLPDIAEAIVGNLHENYIACWSNGSNPCDTGNYDKFWVFSPSGTNKAALSNAQTGAWTLMPPATLTNITYCVK